MSLVLTLALLLGGDPTVVVTSIVKVGMAPASFKPVARVLDPAQRITCPTFEWNWGDGCVSKTEPDCELQEDPSTRPLLRVFTPARFHVYYTPGPYDISFIVHTQEREYRGTISIVVAGPVKPE